MRLSYDDLYQGLLRVLLKLGFRDDRAALCARLFTDSSRDGVYSHGLNRFPRFVEMIRNGSIDIQARPERLAAHGAFEQWDGRLGPGNLNAYGAMNRAIALARVHGVGCVGLRNTNHWMRGGTYGWQAAEAGMVGMCWTNTNQNMPPWGSKEARIGNNPLVLAVPRADGHVVLDMALAQFSYGALHSYALRDEDLPVAGGYDADGNLTRDPAAIADAYRPLPIGFWKGSGLSILLDLMAVLLSGGRSTREIDSDPLLEVGLSQVFVAFDPARFYDPGQTDRMADAVVAHLHDAEPDEQGRQVRYPGEGTLAKRRENTKRGIPVEPSIWAEVEAM